jgi:hypothetical protein
MSQIPSRPSYGGASINGLSHESWRRAHCPRPSRTYLPESWETPGEGVIRIAYSSGRTPRLRHADQATIDACLDEPIEWESLHLNKR